MTSLAEWAPTLIGGGLSLASAVCLIRIRVAARHARNAVADAVERHFNVLEAVREGVCIVDADLRVTHMNDEAERILDRTAEAGVGFPLENAADPLASALVPDIRAARGSGLPIERTYAFPSLLRWVEVRIMPTADETLISLRDVSAQRVAESQLNANSHSLQLVENNVDAVLWTVGRDCRFSAVSGGALAELGLTSATLIGRSVRRAHLGGAHPRRPHRTPRARAIGARRALASAPRRAAGRPRRRDHRRHRRLDQHHRAQAHAARALRRRAQRPAHVAAEPVLARAAAARRRRGRARRRQPLRLLFLDLDRFKAINDTLGHGAGDAVLREVALRLQKCMRGADFIARPGGDEFVILLSRIASITDVEFLSRRIIEALSAPIRLQERTVYVGVSVGAAVFPDHGRDAEALTAHADAAMYRAKAAGGGALAIYDRTLQALDAERFALEADLREAVARNEFKLEYQPLVDLARNEIVGCEALLRWHHPIRGTISPEVFVPIAEASSSIVEIDRWVLARSVRRRGEIPGDRTQAQHVREPVAARSA